MTRREFVEKVSVGSAAMVAGGVLAGGMDAPDAAAQEGEHHENVSGPLANATVSFGAWPIPLDRTVPPVGPPPNVHRLIRSEEHTSELQSTCNLVCRLLLAKKRKELSAQRRLHSSHNAYSASRRSAASVGIRMLTFVVWPRLTRHTRTYD